MSKIFFNGGCIWNKDYLPSEEKALAMIRTYVGHENASQEAAVALSAGIDARVNGKWFTVELRKEEMPHD